MLKLGSHPIGCKPFLYIFAKRSFLMVKYFQMYFCWRVCGSEGGQFNNNLSIWCFVFFSFIPYLSLGCKKNFNFHLSGKYVWQAVHLKKSLTQSFRNSKRNESTLLNFTISYFWIMMNNWLQVKNAVIHGNGYAVRILNFLHSKAEDMLI